MHYSHVYTWSCRKFCYNFKLVWKFKKRAIRDFIVIFIFLLITVSRKLKNYSKYSYFALIRSLCQSGTYVSIAVTRAAISVCLRFYKFRWRTLQAKLSWYTFFLAKNTITTIRFSLTPLSTWNYKPNWIKAYCFDNRVTELMAVLSMWFFYIGFYVNLFYLFYEKLYLLVPWFPITF